MEARRPEFRLDPVIVAARRRHEGRLFLAALGAWFALMAAATIVLALGAAR